MSRLAEAAVVDVGGVGGEMGRWRAPFMNPKKTFLLSLAFCHSNERVTDAEGSLIKQKCKITRESTVDYSRSCLFG